MSVFARGDKQVGCRGASRAPATGQTTITSRRRAQLRKRSSTHFSFGLCSPAAPCLRLFAILPTPQRPLGCTDSSRPVGQAAGSIDTARSGVRTPKDFSWVHRPRFEVFGIWRLPYMSRLSRYVGISDGRFASLSVPLHSQTKTPSLGVVDNRDNTTERLGLEIALTYCPCPRHGNSWERQDL